MSSSLYEGGNSHPQERGSCVVLWPMKNSYRYCRNKPLMGSTEEKKQMKIWLRKSLLQLCASPFQNSERVKLSLALSSHSLSCNHLHQTQLFSSDLGNNFHQIFGHLLIFHSRPRQKGEYTSDCSLCFLLCAILTPACAQSCLSCLARVRLGLTLRGLTASYTRQLCCSTAGSRLTAICWVF